MTTSPHSYNSKRRDRIDGFPNQHPGVFKIDEPIEIVTYPPPNSRSGHSGWTLIAWQAEHGLIGWHLINANGVVSNISNLTGAGRMPRKAVGGWQEEVLAAVAKSPDVGQMAWR